jgi:hypothetical protein
VPTHNAERDKLVHEATHINLTAEEKRLEDSRDHTKHWKRWGPYLSERQSGTVGLQRIWHGVRISPSRMLLPS